MGAGINYLGNEGLDTLIDETYKEIDKRGINYSFENGTLKITGGGFSGSGGDSLHEYSTDEKVVGKWIDGKPLYEKTFEVPKIPYSKYHTIVESVAYLNIDSVISYDGCCYREEYNLYEKITGVAINDYDDMQGYNVRIWNGNLEVMQHYIREEVGATVTIQYTKTTD